MSEKFPGGGFENKKEDFPSEESVLEIFKDIIGGKESKVIREFEDEKGLYLKEIRIEMPDGGYVEYQFMRKGQFLEGKSSTSNIDFTNYDETGMPVGGEIFARYENGKWNIAE